jgi:LmbE family N-acetylglucosaminyl deacetylase
MRERASPLVVARSSRDEMLASGGLVALAAAAKHPVDVVLITDDDASRRGSIAFPPRCIAGVRLAAMRTAVTMLQLGADRLSLLGLWVGPLTRDRTVAGRPMERTTGCSQRPCPRHEGYVRCA